MNKNGALQKELLGIKYKIAGGGALRRMVGRKLWKHSRMKRKQKRGDNEGTDGWPEWKARMRH